MGDQSANVGREGPQSLGAEAAMQNPALSSAHHGQWRATWWPEKVVLGESARPDAAGLSLLPDAWGGEG